MPDIDQAVFQCPLSGRRLQLTLVVRLVVLVVSAFKCPLRGRGLQHSNRFATNCAKQFQSPLSGRGLQQNWLTRIVSMHCFNALLAGGVCSTAANAITLYARFGYKVKQFGLVGTGFAGTCTAVLDRSG